MLLKCPALCVPNSYSGFCRQAMNGSLTHWQWTRFSAVVKHGSTSTNLHHVGFTSSLYSVHYTVSLQDIWQMKCTVHCFSTDRVGVLCKGTYFNGFFSPASTDLTRLVTTLGIHVPNHHRNVSEQQLTCIFLLLPLKGLSVLEMCPASALHNSYKSKRNRCKYNQ